MKAIIQILRLTEHEEGVIEVVEVAEAIEGKEATEEIEVVEVQEVVEEAEVVEEEDNGVITTRVILIDQEIIHMEIMIVKVMMMLLGVSAVYLKTPVIMLDGN